MGSTMILDRNVEIYSRQSSSGDRGIKQFTYSLFSKTKASIQPESLNQVQLAQWGITDIAANAKKMFLPGTIKLNEGMLVKDLRDTSRYEIRACNVWPNHSELILTPYQGGDPI